MPTPKDSGKRTSLSLEDKHLALLVKLKHAEEVQCGRGLSTTAVIREAIAYMAKLKHGIKV